MDLFSDDEEAENLLPRDGTVYYYRSLLPAARADYYLKVLSEQVAWRPDEAFVYGRHILTSRQVAWYGEKPFAYRYSHITKYALPWIAPLLELKAVVERRTGESFNACLLNGYHHGEEAMGWHSDSEPELKKNGAIGSVSLGAERPFAFKHKQTAETVRLVLAHGSLLVMQGVTQAHWLHRLPPAKRISAPRVNLTFRTISQ